MVEGKRGVAVNPVVNGEPEEDKGDNREEAIRSDNTGGDGAKTNGLAERERKEAMAAAARMAAKTAYMRSAGIEEVNLKDKRENDGNKHPACDETNKLTNTLKRKPQVENEALEYLLNNNNEAKPCLQSV